MDDVALGHTTKMCWNEDAQWIYSEQLVHPPIIDEPTFKRAQEMLAARRGVRGEHKPHRARRPYALRGVLVCGLCERKMQGHWANDAPCYRCRFPSEYALANRVQHPRNVTLRQDAVLPPLDAWLAGKFSPRHLADTIDELAAAVIRPGQMGADRDDHTAKIAECDRKLASYRAALDAGAEPAVVARWITDTEAEKARYAAITRPVAPQAAISRDEIAAHVARLADVLTVLRHADAADKADMYPQLGLHLTYQPGDRIIRTEMKVVSPAGHCKFESVRGGT
jgi:hypothetical protein